MRIKRSRRCAERREWREHGEGYEVVVSSLIVRWKWWGFEQRSEARVSVVRRSRSGARTFGVAVRVGEGRQLPENLLDNVL